MLGNPVVETTVIVVAVLVRAPFKVVLLVLVRIGLHSALTSTLSKNAYNRVLGFIPVAVKLV